MSETIAPLLVAQRPVTQAADTFTMQAYAADRGCDYVDHRKPVCVAPYLYVQPLILRQVDGLMRRKFTVWFVWTDTREPLDMRISHGISTGDDVVLASQLAAATACGRVFPDGAEVKTNPIGRYVEARCAVQGKTLRSDLAKLRVGVRP